MGQICVSNLNFSFEILIGQNRRAMSQCPESLLKPLEVRRKLLMGPGPANCSPRVLNAASQPLLGHLHPDFCTIMDDIKTGIQHLFQTVNALTLALCASGHAAMECTLINACERGETVLIACNGIWGERATDMATRAGINAVQLTGTPGVSFSLAEIEAKIAATKPKAFFITHGESSTGVLQNLEGIGKICHKYGVLCCVDSVAACGGVPMKMDEWEIDILYTGSQKGLSAPPGTAPISFSPRAREAIAARKTPVQSFYLDAHVLARYWNADGAPRFYHHTGAVTNLFALREALAEYCAVPLEESWANHAACAEELHKGLAHMGLKLYVPNKADRLPTVTTIKVPEGFPWAKINGYLMEKYALEIAGGLGPSAGQVWRIGLMGYNCTSANVKFVLEKMDEAYQQFK